jgi:hypothetical protein
MNLPISCPRLLIACPSVLALKTDCPHFPAKIADFPLKVCSEGQNLKIKSSGRNPYPSSWAKIWKFQK